jgi:hypothetical protein
VPLFADSAYPLPVGSPKFAGTLIQRFNVRNGRAARPYRDNIGEIKEKVAQAVVPALALAGMTLDPAAYEPLTEYCLGEIPDFQGLLPKSHDAGVPVFALRDNEIGETGPVLANAIERRDRFAAQFAGISGNLLRMLEYA